MNVLASECSSGCESGWTLYLDNSSHRNGNGHCGDFCEENYYEEEKFSVKANEHDDDDQEEEDLSMVSDASSGPPHFNEDEALGYFNDFKGTSFTTKMPNNNGGKRLKKKEQGRREKEKLPSVLDDTASSPIINFSSKNDIALTKNNQLASMESVLATEFHGRSAFQDHFGFLQPSLSGNHFQNNQWY